MALSLFRTTMKVLINTLMFFAIFGPSIEPPEKTEIAQLEPAPSHKVNWLAAMFLFLAFLSLMVTPPQIANKKSAFTATTSKTILDSGASHIFLTDRNEFYSMTPCSGQIATAGGRSSYTHVGPSKWAQNSFYAPDFKSSLISISVIAKDKGAALVFDENCACIVPREHVRFSSKPNIIARVEDGLYVVDKKHQETMSALAVGKPNSKKLSVLAKLHRRLGHVNVRKIINAVCDGFLVGVTLTKEEVANARHFSCAICNLFKTKRKPRKRGVVNSEAAQFLIPLLTVHSDTIGPFIPKSQMGFRYVHAFTERSARYAICFCMRKKSDALAALKKYKPRVELEFAKLTGKHHKLKCLVTDKAKELISWEWTSYSIESGLHNAQTAPYSASQNGLEERSGGKICTMARTMLAGAPHVPNSLWPYAVRFACWVWNHLPNEFFSPKVSPYQRLTHKAPNLQQMHQFGALCTAHLVGSEVPRGKIAATAVEVYYLGRHPTSQSHCVWDPVSKKVYDRKDVNFTDNIHDTEVELVDLKATAEKLANHPKLVIEGLDDSDDEEENDGQKLPNIPYYNPYKNFYRIPDAKDIDAPNINPIPDGNDAVNRPDLIIPPRPATPAADDLKDQGAVDSKTPVTKTKKVGFDLPDDHIDRKHQRKSKRNRTKPGKWWEANGVNLTEAEVNSFINNARAFVADVENEVIYDNEPKTIAEALEIDRRTGTTHWADAIRYEFRRCIKMRIWRVRNRCRHHHVITTRWVFKHKNPGTKYERYRARLVAHGYKTISGVEYDPDECYAPVARYESIRVLLALAAAHNLIIYDADIKSAYLFAKLPKPTFVELPAGFNASAIPPGINDPILQLNFALYGLKNSGHLWHKQFHEYLTKIGCRRMISDNCIYVLRRCNSWLAFALFVDNLFIVAKCQQILIYLITALQAKYEITHGPLEQGLGMEITLVNDGIRLTCEKYIDKIRQKFIENEPKEYKATTPLPTNFILSKKVLEGDAPANKGDFFAIVGCINRANQTCRPDVCFAAYALSRFSNAPTVRHYKYALHTIKYLAKYPKRGITYHSKTPNPPLITFADASHNAVPSTSRSITGFAVYLLGGLIYWKTASQTVLALSPNESEYIALSMAAQASMFVRMLAQELGIGIDKFKVTYIFGDNKGANAMAQTNGTTKRTRHVRIKFHHIRELVAERAISIQKIASEDQPADVLTKPLAEIQHAKLTQRCSWKITRL